jgi:integrase
MSPRPLVRAGLETGCRYGELARLETRDFHPDSGTIHIRKSKSGKARHVMVTDDGVVFFKRQVAGRAGSELIFTKANGAAWQASDQGRPMRDACRNARINPPISFHILRHCWASLAAMSGVPLAVIAQNLGHADRRMTEKHYAHLSASYARDVIRACAPQFGIDDTRRKIVPLK